MSFAFRRWSFYTIAITLLICTLGHALPPHGKSPPVSRRSLPGSLAVAPDGAIGYYEPPQGPKAQTIEIDIEPTITAQEITHELREVPIATGNGGIDK